MEFVTSPSKIASGAILFALSLSFMPARAQSTRSKVDEFNNLKGCIYSVVNKSAPLEFKFGEWVPGAETVIDTVYYNAAGKVDRIIKASQMRGLCKETSVFYTTDNKVDKIRECGSIIEMTYTDGKLTKADTRSNVDNSLEGRETWQYTPDGYKYTIYNSMGDIENIKTVNGRKLTQKSTSGTYNLNAQNQPVSYTYENDTYKYLETWTYNGNDDLTSHTERRWIKGRTGWEEIPAASVEETIAYTYDSNNNWTKKISTRTSHSPEATESTIHTRDFVYFPSPQALEAHLKELENQKAQTAAEAAQEKEICAQEIEKERKRRQEEAEASAQKVKDQQLIGQIQKVLSRKIWIEPKRDSYKLILSDKADSNDYIKPTINADGSYTLIRKTPKSIYGPYLFNGTELEVEARLAKSEAGTHTLPNTRITFSATLSSDAAAALLTYNDQSCILIFETENTGPILFLLRR